MKFTNYLLAPVLLAQGLWVKFKTPKLSEFKTPPEHPQNNHLAEQSKKLKVLLLGDSSAAGVGADDFSTSLMGQLIKQMPCYIDPTLWADSGDTTKMAIDKLVSKADETFDVVITALGVNDVISRINPAVWVIQQKQLLELITKKHKAKLIIVCGLPPMNKFPALPQPLRGYLAGKASQMDLALQQLLDNDAGRLFFPLHSFPENLPTASDGFHPGPEAYRYWARQLSLTITRHFDWH